MMQSGKNKALLVGAGLILFLMVVLRTAVWGDFIQNKLNDAIAHTGWSIQAKKSSGYLFGTMHLDSITIHHQSGLSAHAEKSSVNFGHISSLFGDLTFDLISVEGLTTTVDSSWANLSPNHSQDTISLPFKIRAFFLDGTIATKVYNDHVSVDLLLGGEFEGGDTPTLTFDLFKIQLGGHKDIGIDFTQLALGYDGAQFYLNQLSGMAFGYPIHGQMNLDKMERTLAGNINVGEIQIPEELFSKLPLKTKFSTFKGQFDFNSDFNYFSGKLLLENDLGLDMTGEFSIGKEADVWILKQLKLDGERSNLTMNGVWQNNERISCYMNLNDLDLSRWLEGQSPTQLSGLAILEGGLSSKGFLEEVDLTLEVEESKLFQQGDISVHGQISYQDSLISTVDPVMVMVGDSYLIMDGEGNFKNQTLDILVDLEQAEIELVNRFLPGDFISGKATGQMKVQGKYDTPSVTAELQCENIVVEEFHLESLDFNSQILVSDTETTGFVDMKTSEGTWRDRSFESGTVNATLDSKGIQIENCHFKSGNDFFQASGFYDGNEDYTIDRIQLAYETHYLVNAKPLTFSFQDSLLIMDPFEVHINDGRLEGVITGGVEPEGRFKMSNFDSEILTQFFTDKRLHFSGIVFGEVWVQWANQSLNMDADISLKNGTYMEEPFDEMTLSFLFKNGMLHMDDIAMTRGTLMGIEANGIIPLGKKQVGHRPISLQSNFSNISMEFIHHFIPNFFYLGGRASGNFHLKGFPDETQFSYDFSVKDGVFDVIECGDVTTKGKYDGQHLIVESATAIRPDGKITAYGKVPYDFNINSEKFGQLFPRDSIDFHTEGQLGSLPFLSPYIADLDSARGKFDIGLSLTGPVDAIQRDGSISIQNGNIYTLLISDPVTGVNGKAVMKNNLLTIQNMKSVLYHDNGKYQNNKNPNTTITGTLDFTQFFNPGYNLRVKGKEASFKTLYLDIAGQSNVDVSIVGQDTVEIAGTIEALDATVFYEFSTEDLGTALQEEAGTIMSYQINIPIKGSALFQNSQVDAIVTGELSLSQIGHQEIDFGGEIFVDDGHVFSYKDNFKGLEGYVSFDNKGFNPTMDLNAFTMIDDEKIDLRISGKVDDLNINLESASGFSESDILELLTWGKRFEDQELTSTGFGNQTVSILGSLLENQLEKNLKESEIGKMGLVDDINISGTAGLIQGADEDFEVTAKRQIGDKTFLNLSYKRSFSLTNPNQSQIGVEYKLNRHFSVVGNVDEDGNLNLKYRYRYAY